MRLTKRLQSLLLGAVKVTKSYDPIIVLGYIEDEVTQPESRAIESFLRWCIARNARFGWNLPKVWFSWRVSVRRTKVRTLSLLKTGRSFA